ncbi:hypothetical protein D3C72_1215560 [compost metagenome]
MTGFDDGQVLQHIAALAAQQHCLAGLAREPAQGVVDRGAGALFSCGPPAQERDPDRRAIGSKLGVELHVAARHHGPQQHRDTGLRDAEALGDLADAQRPAHALEQFQQIEHPVRRLDHSAVHSSPSLARAPLWRCLCHASDRPASPRCLPFSPPSTSPWRWFFYSNHSPIIRRISAFTAAGSMEARFRRCTEIPRSRLIRMKAADFVSTSARICPRVFASLSLYST